MRWLAIVFTGLIIYIVYLANTQADIFGFVNIIPFGDKWGHFILIGTLSFVINLALWQNGRLQNRRHLIVVSTLIAVLVTAEEISQIWLPTRNFSLIDLAFDYLGILSFSLIIDWLIKHKLPSLPA